MYKILFTLISTISFGIIDGSFTLFFEETIQNKFLKNEGMDLNSAGLLVGGISAATSIFFLSVIEEFVSSYIDIISHPLLDSIGIIIGTIVVIIVYNNFLKDKNHSVQENKSNKINQR